MSVPRTALAARRSERVARFALGFALDADLTVADAAALLIDRSDHDATLLRLARARIVKLALEEPTYRRAIEALSIALAAAEKPQARFADERSATGLIPLGQRDTLCVVLVGPPGAGKGTQGHVLAQRLDLVHISTGELLRDVADQESLVGFQARVFMGAGRLVPDSLVMELLSARFARDDVRGRGLILDGVPRTVGQAGVLDELLGADRDFEVVELMLSESTALTRLDRRNRGDDSSDSVRRRFQDYEAQTRPMLGWYQQRHVVWRIDGDRPAPTVTAEIVDRLAGHRGHHLRDLAR